MKTTELILGYLKGLLQKWYLVVIAILDFVGLLILLYTDLEIPIWLTLIIFGAVFLYANFLLYRDGQHEIHFLKEQYEIKVSELSERIKNIELRQPKLELFFSKEGQLLRKLELLFKNVPQKPDYEELVGKEAEALKNTFAKQSSISGKSNSLKIDIFGIRKTSEEYKKDCADYLIHYRHYLKNLYFSQTYTARYRQINIALQNTGSAPGEEIIIFLEFPDEFHFLTEDEQEQYWLHQEYPEPPERPSITKNLLPNIRLSSLLSTPLHIHDSQSITPQRTVRGPIVKIKNSTEVRFEVDSILHNLIVEEFDSIDFFVTDEAVGHSWEIPYTIHVGNLPETVKGSLIVEVVLQPNEAEIEKEQL